MLWSVRGSHAFLINIVNRRVDAPPYLRGLDLKSLCHLLHLLQYFPNTGRVSDDELNHIFADDLFFDDAALLRINNILKDMKKKNGINAKVSKPIFPIEKKSLLCIMI